MLKKISIYNFIINNIIGFIIFSSSIQMGLKWGFNITINRYIQYLLIIIYIIMKKRKNINIGLMGVSLLSITILLSSKLLSNNLVIDYYIEEFILSCLPVIILLTFEKNIYRINKVLSTYSVIIIVLYLYCIMINPSISIYHYMTWGYNFLFAVSFILINSIVFKKFITLLLCIILVILGIFYGPKGGLLVITTSIIISIFYKIKNKKIRWVFSIFLVGIIIKSKDIIYGIVINLKEQFGLESYSINSVIYLLEQSNLSDMLTSRMDIYNDALNFIELHPFGSGLGEFHANYGTYPHNIILDIFVTFGIVGGIILLISLIFLNFKTIKRISNNETFILYTFILSNTTRLLFSKSFIWEQSFWLLISIDILIINYWYLKNKDL